MKTCTPTAQQPVRGRACPTNAPRRGYKQAGNGHFHIKSIGLIFALSLLVKALTAIFVSHPGYMDAYYYDHVAGNLASGRGFVEGFLWNYLDNPAGIPHPSNLYWMPLTSLLMAPFRWLLGNSFRATQVSLVLLSSCLPVIAYLTARRFFSTANDAKSQDKGLFAATSALPVFAVVALTIFSGVYFVFWVVPDSFASFAVTGALALWCMARGMEHNARWFLAASAFSALAYLSRPDGLLLLVVLVAMMIAANIRSKDLGRCSPAEARSNDLSRCLPAEARRATPRRQKILPLRTRRPRFVPSRFFAPFADVFTSIYHKLRSQQRMKTSLRGPQPEAIPYGQEIASPSARNDGVRAISRLGLAAASPYYAIRLGVAVLLIYLLVLAPWLYHNWQTVGVLWPGSASEALFQREYNDLFRYGRLLDGGYYLSWGWQNILFSKIQAAGENLLVLAGVFSFYLLPFGLIGFWQVRKRPAAWPYLLYAGLLYLVMTLLFTFAGPRGSLLHSSAALLPFYMVAAVKGLTAAVAWVSRRLPHWQEARAQRNLLAICLIVAVFMSGVLTMRKIDTWDARHALYNRLAAWFTANTPAGAVAMVIDPPGWYYSSGRPAITFANEDLATNVSICRRYGARYLILEADYPRPLRRFYLGEESHPALALRGAVDGVRVYEVLPP